MGGGTNNDRDVGQSDDKDVGKDSGMDAGDYSHKGTAKREDASDVLTGVKRELDYD